MILLPQFNQAFMKKIPVGAEAHNVLVGEVDFLEGEHFNFQAIPLWSRVEKKREKIAIKSFTVPRARK